MLGIGLQAGVIERARTAAEDAGQHNVRPQKGGEWFGGSCAEAIKLFCHVVVLKWRADGGDPRLGIRLGGLLHHRQASSKSSGGWCIRPLSAARPWA